MYRIYSNTIRILFEPAPPIEPAVVLSKFPIIPASKRAFLEIEPADCNRINTVYWKKHGILSCLPFKTITSDIFLKGDTV